MQQSRRIPIHLGRTNNKPQFHLGRTECPVVSSVRRTISQMGRTMSVTDRYFKACLDVLSAVYPFPSHAWEAKPLERRDRSQSTKHDFDMDFDVTV